MKRESQWLAILIGSFSEKSLGKKNMYKTIFFLHLQGAMSQHSQLGLSIRARSWVGVKLLAIPSKSNQQELLKIFKIGACSATLLYTHTDSINRAS